MKQTIVATSCLAALLTLTGCASNQPQAHYTEQSGSGPDSTLEHMPGLIGSLRGHSSDTGLVLYSDNPKDHPLFHPRKAKAAEVGSSSTARMSRHASPAGPTNNEIQEFKRYTSFKHFQSLPRTAPEKQRYRRWLQWRRFEQTMKHKSGQSPQ